MTASLISPITTLPQNLPLDGAIAITLQDGLMIFRASQNIQQRIENLLDKREETPLSETEEQELDDFVAVNYLKIFQHFRLGYSLLRLCVAQKDF